MRVARVVRSVFVFTTVFLASCAQSPHGAESAPLVAASREIGESFNIVKDGKTGEAQLEIVKTALDKEFLLQSAIIEQPVAAMGDSLKSRIVAFRRSGGQIVLVEATAGHSVTSDLPQNMVLTLFPIVEESADAIRFDFNEGMRTIFAANDWTASDADGTDYKSDRKFAEARLSYLEDIKIVQSNKLAIRQIAQVVSSSFLSGSSIVPIEVRYFLSPYSPNPAFQPSHESDFKRVGFFEVAPYLKTDGGTVVHASKFDDKAPIQFAVSANTPDDYKQAVRDGILYWKAVLPNVEAIDAPAGVTAPDMTYNVIQWVPHDRAGMAYADAQMDPRTGEILHAQAFITSAFAFNSRTKARALLRGLGTSPKTKQSISLVGFENRRLCERHGEESLRESLAAVLSSTTDDASILRVSQDYVRATVAHEVGHLLGLRHNFAGSLATKDYPLNRRQEIFEHYLKFDEVPRGLETSSSEMDYLPLEESAIHGQQMRKRPEDIYSYDRIAIEMLYKGKDPTASSVPPFCTDTDLTRYIDCRKHDTGTTALESAMFSVKNATRTLPSQLVQAYVSMKKPAPWERVQAVETFNIELDKVASNIVSPLNVLAGSFDPKRHSLLIARKFPYIGSLNEEAVQQKELEEIQAEAERLGGWEKVFEVPDHAAFTRVFEETEKGLRDPALAGVFSELEIQAILENVLRLGIKLPEAVSKSDITALKALPGTLKLAGTKTGDELLALLNKRARRYVLGLNGSNVIEAEVELPGPGPIEGASKAITALVSAFTGPAPEEKKEATPAKPAAKPAAPTTHKALLRLPVFFYSTALRESAGPLLSSHVGTEYLDWGIEERAKLKKEFTALLDRSCGCGFVATSLTPDKIKVTDPAMRKQVLRWFADNRKVWMALP